MGIAAAGSMATIVADGFMNPFDGNCGLDNALSH